MAMKKKLNSAGFTLLETIVAISILTIAVAGPMTLASRSIGSVSESKNGMISFYLAQESMEYIRNKRDNNVFSGLDWLDGFGLCINGKQCCIDAVNDNIKRYPNTCGFVKYDETGGNYYNHSTGDDTIFTRIAEITKIGVNEAEIEVSVSWINKFGANKSVVLVEHIFDWK